MGDNFRKVRSGERWKPPPATLWNDILDTVLFVKRLRASAPPRARAAKPASGGEGDGVIYDAFTGMACGDHGSWFYLSLADMRATTQDVPSGTVTHTIRIFDADGVELVAGLFPYDVELAVGETKVFSGHELPFSTLADAFHRYEVRAGTGCDGEDVAVSALYDGYWNVFQRG